MLLMLLTVFFLAFDTSSVAVRARSLRVLKPGIYDAVCSTFVGPCALTGWFRLFSV